MPQVSNYNTITSSQGGMPAHFLTNAVTNPDQLRQRVAFALSQIFVTSLQKLIWNDNMVLFQNMLLADAFTNYRQIMADVTLSPAMGQYLDMANNAMAESRGGHAGQRELRARADAVVHHRDADAEPGWLASSTTAINLPIPTYSQPTIAEFARVYTGWTYAPAAGQPVVWNAYISSNGPMVAYPAEHDSGLQAVADTALRFASRRHAAAGSEQRARQYVQPSQRRTVRRQDADPAPGEEQSRVPLISRVWRPPSITMAKACAAI